MLTCYMYYFSSDGIDLQTLQLGQTNGVHQVFLDPALNDLSEKINISGGFPFGVSSQENLYVRMLV